MGVLAFILDKVASTIDRLVDALPKFEIPFQRFNDAIATFEQYLGIVNYVFPMDTLITVIGILCSFSIAMFMYYQIQRLINLMRGAG